MCTQCGWRKILAKGLCKPCYQRNLLATDPAYRERQKRVAYRSRVRRKYGLSVEEYEALLARPCGICGGKSTHLDHDHRCHPLNEGCRECIRGGLCNKCNAGMGYLEGWYDEHKDRAEQWRDIRALRAS